MSITSTKMLAHALHNERKKRKLSQDKVADSIGIKQSTVSEFENYPDGTRLETLFKLLAALDLELQVTKRGELSRIWSSSSNITQDQEGLHDQQGWDQEW
ncbi:helix-turn-helix domain-containing protein [Photorhabdus stackebrandtii]|uniref:Transcriptional regulator n=1 Tax=Photorhabdus stackebrandtii TaxID=1123042 RepID=A0A7X5QIU7_9GAMM|nr:helix-turn-helix domain-containing protein [Photorhabdus stackebrandtii]NHB95039.1 transcriptional regulator [Photorhabdus stackebrandtii]